MYFSREVSKNSSNFRTPCSVSVAALTNPGGNKLRILFTWICLMASRSGGSRSNQISVVVELADRDFRSRYHSQGIGDLAADLLIVNLNNLCSSRSFGQNRLDPTKRASCNYCSSGNFCAQGTVDVVNACIAVSSANSQFSRILFRSDKPVEIREFSGSRVDK